MDGKERNPRSRVEHFVQIWNGSYNTVRDCELRFATGWRGVDLDDGAHHNRIIDNIVDFVGVYDDGQGNDWGDSIVIENAHNNLIQGNVVLHGAHNLLRVKGENNVIRGNVFDNSWSTVLAPGLGGRNLALMGRRNVFEENIVRNSGASIDKAANAGMKAEGRDNIVRRNYIYRNSSEGIMSESRSGQPYAHNNHIFHNTIYGNDGPGWRLEMYNGGNSPVGNVFKNNVVYDNRQNAFNSTYDVDVLFKLARSSTGVVAGSLIDGNLIYKQASGDAVVYIQDGGSRQDLGSAEASFRDHIRNNRMSGVSFSSVDPKLPEDFDLQPGSAGIDSGLPLTHTTTSGNGTEIHVEDAGYFTDGFGVVPGDMIRVGTQSDVRVVSVRYDQNSIVVSNSVQWSAGAPVSLAYSGAAPDVGAREYGLSNNVGGPAQPRPPRQLRISR